MKPTNYLLLSLLYHFAIREDFANSKKDSYLVTISMKFFDDKTGFLFSNLGENRKEINFQNVKSKNFYMIEYELTRNLCLRDIDPIAGKFSNNF